MKVGKDNKQRVRKYLSNSFPGVLHLADLPTANPEGSVCFLIRHFMVLVDKNNSSYSLAHWTGQEMGE